MVSGEIGMHSRHLLSLTPNFSWVELGGRTFEPFQFQRFLAVSRLALLNGTLQSLLMSLEVVTLQAMTRDQARRAVDSIPILFLYYGEQLVERQVGMGLV